MYFPAVLSTLIYRSFFFHRKRILNHEIDEVYKMKPIKEGKVREIYDNGDSLILVATDRISCFDVILKSCRTT